jgi:hypothetical protein
MLNAQCSMNPSSTPPCLPAAPAPQTPSHQFSLAQTNPHPFADKARLIDDFCRPVRFILHRRRAGIIANLPAPVREQINCMLRDGLPYAGVRARIGDRAKGLNKDNLSRWRKAGHQDWLTQQAWLEATRGRPEPPPEAKDLAFLLHDLDPSALHSAMARDPGTYVRLINAAVRMASTALDQPQPRGRLGT